MYETGTTCGSPFFEAVANLHSSFCSRNAISVCENLTVEAEPFNLKRLH
jgi:hypothetical protein